VDAQGLSSVRRAALLATDDSHLNDVTLRNSPCPESLPLHNALHTAWSCDGGCGSRHQDDSHPKFAGACIYSVDKSLCFAQRETIRSPPTAGDFPVHAKASSKVVASSTEGWDRLYGVSKQGRLEEEIQQIEARINGHNHHTRSGWGLGMMSELSCPLFWPTLVPNRVSYEEIIGVNMEEEDRIFLSSPFFMFSPGGSGTDKPPVKSCSLPLDPICSSTMDLDILIQLALDKIGESEAEDFLEAIRLITDPNAFLDLFISTPKSVLSRTALSPQDFLVLEEADFLSYQQPFLTMGAFKVPKKNNLSRLILNASRINEAQSSPLDIKLSQVHTIAQAVAKAEMVFTIDAKSYFYQFALHQYIARFFGFRLNRGRGAPRELCFIRMPMGWKFAPAIAQRTSRFILRLLQDRLPHLTFFSDVWIDNFIFACKRADVAEILRTFENLAASFNLNLHPPEYHGVFLGLEKRGSEVFISSKMAQKWKDLIEKLPTEHSARTRAGALGFAFFISYLTHTGDCGDLSGAARSLSAQVHKAGWDVNLKGNQELHVLLQSAFSRMIDKPIRVLTFDEDSAAYIFSDASLQGWAFSISSAGSQEIQLLQYGVFTDLDERIFIKELRAALTALLTAATIDPAGNFYMAVDNTAVFYAMKSQRSSNDTANAWLASVFRAIPETFRYRMRYLHTSRNPVDCYTRLSTRV